MKSSVIWFFNLSLCVLFLSACGGGSKPQSDLKIFKFNLESCESADPAFSKSQAVMLVVNQMFNGLVQLNEKMEIKPSIAKYWEVSPDGLSYIFHLRKGVFFHDHEAFKGGKGREVIASDFVYSLNRILDPKVASPGSWIFNGRVNPELPFEAVNDSTFKVSLLQPFPPFLGILSMQYCSVVPKEVVEKYGKDFYRNPVGTGPFKFKIWEDAQVMMLVKNENYWEKEGQQQLPYIDGVRITFIQEKQIEFLKFMKGDLDFLSTIDATIKDEIITKEGKLKPEHAAKISMDVTPYLNTEYLGFMLDSSIEEDVKGNKNKDNPLLIKEVRQAINYGIDRAKLISILRNNIGVPADKGFIPPVMLGRENYDFDGYEYNPMKSRELLAKAGFPNGEGLPEIIFFTDDKSMDLCAALQSQLKSVGIKLQMEQVSRMIIREWMSQSKIFFFYGQWIADYPDPETFLTVFWGGNPAPPNYTRFKNSAFDALYEKALNEPDFEARKQYYFEMDKIVIDEAPIVPLYYDVIINFTYKNISGLSVTPSKLISLKRVKIKDEE